MDLFLDRSISFEFTAGWRLVGAYPTNDDLGARIALRFDRRACHPAHERQLADVR